MRPKANWSPAAPGQKGREAGNKQEREKGRCIAAPDALKPERREVVNGDGTDDGEDSVEGGGEPQRFDRSGFQSFLRRDDERTPNGERVDAKQDADGSVALLLFDNVKFYYSQQPIKLIDAAGDEVGLSCRPASRPESCGSLL